MGFGVLGFRVLGLGVLGFRVRSLGFRGVGFSGFEIRVEGLGCPHIISGGHPRALQGFYP